MTYVSYLVMLPSGKEVRHTSPLLHVNVTPIPVKTLGGTSLSFAGTALVTDPQDQLTIVEISKLKFERIE